MLIPGWPQIEEFPVPLEPGERAVIEAYERLASSLKTVGYELNVYVQPYLENYRPDVVVGMRGNGLLIIEVKDWKPDSKTRPKQVSSAIEQVRFYREQLLQLCMPEIEGAIIDPGLEKYRPEITRLLYQSVRVAVAVPFLTNDRIELLFLNKSVPVINSEKLLDLYRLIRPTRLEKSSLPQDLHNAVIAQMWKSLNSWLMPPYHRAEQGRLSKSDLTQAQSVHAVSRGPGWYRLRGPAGSGKSLVLAHKAAFMAAERKRVLLVCYNATLTHYLRDLAARMRYDFAWENIVIRYFHSLLKEIRLAFGVSFTKEDHESEEKDKFISEYYPRIVANLLHEHPNHQFKFDAILIDEGQDFQVNWFQVLAQCLTGNGELLFARDGHQNIYNKDNSWSDGNNSSMRGLKGLRGFSGKWAELKTTWRMSPTITRAISEFAVRELRATAFTVDANRVEQRELYAGSTFCRWENVLEQHVDARLVEVANQVTQMATPSHPSDFAVLMHTNKMAWHVVELLEQAGYPAVHVYDSDGNRDKKKLVRFRKGDGRVKVCTGHNFKGYEIWGVILLVSPWKSGVEQARWVYTSMGRTIEGLWVLNADPVLNHVSDWFPNE